MTMLNRFFTPVSRRTSPPHPLSMKRREETVVPPTGGRQGTVVPPPRSAGRGLGEGFS